MNPERYRKKHLSPAKKLAVLVLILSMSAAAFLGYRGIMEMRERTQGVDYYQSLVSEKIYKSDLPRMSGKADDGDGFLLLPMTGPTSALDFESLQEKYPDIVGWLEIKDLGIDYPIMQGEDNEYYLKHLADGRENNCGAIMMDAICDGDFGDHVTTIHGHHLKNGSMFGSLATYGNKAFFQSHPSFRIYTPGGDYEVQVIAAYTADPEELGFPVTFADEDHLQSFVNSMRVNSPNFNDLDVHFGDRLVMLSTCAYSFKNARFVVVGRLQYTMD